MKISNINKERYIKFCEGNIQVPIFLQPWWLDIACKEDNWDVTIVESGGLVRGVMPFYVTRKYGFKGISMPPFTPFMSYYLFYPPDQKYHAKLSYEKKIISELILKLPKVSFFYLLFPPEISNWLPLYWMGFKQTTRYTYIIKELKNLDSIFSNFSHNARKQIRKATKEITITRETNPEILYDMLNKTYSKQNIKIPYQFDEIQSLFNSKVSKYTRLYIARDKSNIVHAAAFMVTHNDVVYNILRGSNPTLHQSGAMSLLIWETIKEYSSEGIEIYDFAGSMIEPIENFVKSFGAIQEPKHQITKEFSFLYFFIKSLHDIYKFCRK